MHIVFLSFFFLPRVAVGAQKHLDFHEGCVEVVVDARAPSTVKFAADEMTNFMSRILGGTVPIVTRPSPGKSSMFLGDSSWSRSKGIDVTELARDGFYSLVDSSGVYLVGRDNTRFDVVRRYVDNGAWGGFERGTLYAVYEFLEEHAGVRFYFPGELGTIVPKCKNLMVANERRKVEPVFTQRHFGAHSERGDWYDPSMNLQQALRLSILRWRYGSFWLPCCHGQRNFHYAERFGKDHPDWFCLMEDGKRNVRQGPCFTSPIREELYQDARAYLTGVPASSRGLERFAGNCALGKYVDLMPEDGYMECHCEKCQLEYDKNSAMWGSKLLWRMFCEFGNRLKREGVSGNLITMAYPPYREIPEFEIPDNVQVMLAERGPWAAGAPVEFERQAKEIKDWRNKLGHTIWLWTYPGKYGLMSDVPQITPRSYAKFFSSVAPDIFGGYIETDSDRFLYDTLNVYVYSRLGWNPRLDIDALLTEYYLLMFGSAAEPMRLAHEFMENKWVNDIAGHSIDTAIGPVCFYPDEGKLWRSIYSTRELDKLKRHFDAAAAAVARESIEARRIALFRKELLDPMLKKGSYCQEALSVPKEMARRHSRQVKSILENGDFNGMKGWQNHIGDAILCFDPDIKVVGCGSARLQTSNDELSREYVRAECTCPIRLTEGRKYRLSYFLKTKDVKPLAAHSGAYVCIWQGKGKWKKCPHPPITGTEDWAHMSCEFVAEGPGDRLQFRLTEAVGTMWVDGVLLEGL